MSVDDNFTNLLFWGAGLRSAGAAARFVVIGGNICHIGISFVLATEYVGEVAFKIRQADSILGSGRAGDGRDNLGKIQFENFAVFGIFGA